MRVKAYLIVKVTRPYGGCQLLFRAGVRLPLYPEERTTSRPTAEQILKLYAHTQRHTITKDGLPLHSYETELTQLQRDVLELLKIPATRYEQPQTPTPT